MLKIYVSHTTLITVLASLSTMVTMPILSLAYECHQDPCHLWVPACLLHLEIPINRSHFH